MQQNPNKLEEEQKIYFLNKIEKEPKKNWANRSNDQNDMSNKVWKSFVYFEDRVQIV